MNHSGIIRVALLLVVATSTLAAQPQDALPRFRAGAALVQVDAYIAQDGIPVTDLGPADLEVFEDDRPQAISTIKLVQPRNSVLSAPVSATPDGALFVLFFDTVHLDPKKAERAQEQMAKLLNSVIGPHDRVGVMTPDISAQNITLTRSASSVDEVLRDMSLLDQDTGIAPSEARERELELCYPDTTMVGVAKELIERRREQRTLRGLDDLVTFLEGRRDERKFVILISEGWALHRPNEQLAALQTGESRRRDAGIDACEAERKMLATVDGTVELRKLAQRANRANVSVYPIDPSGFGTGPITATADVGEATARQWAARTGSPNRRYRRAHNERCRRGRRAHARRPPAVLRLELLLVQSELGRTLSARCCPCQAGRDRSARAAGISVADRSGGTRQRSRFLAARSIVWRHQ